MTRDVTARHEITTHRQQKPSFQTVHQ